jgi:hypothetical protein
MKELLEAVFSMRSAPMLHKESTLRTRVEAGSNISTISLRFVGDDEKENQFLGLQLGYPVPHPPGWAVSNLKQ